MLLAFKYGKTLIKNLMLPPTGPLLLAFAGLLLLRRRPRLGRAFIAVGLAALWLLSTPWVADQITRAAEPYPALDPGRPVQAGAIVILGGGGQRAFAPEYRGPAAEPYLLEKLAYGAYLARRLQLPILVTGYHIEATAMRDSLARNFDLSPRWVDDQSYDTFENAAHSARLLHAAGISRVVLLTRSTHMLRAVREFTAAGLQVVPAPVGVESVRETAVYRYLPYPDALLRSYAAVYELLAERVRAALAVMHLRRQQGPRSAQ